MIVDDLDVPGFIIPPHEADAPLIIASAAPRINAISSAARIPTLRRKLAGPPATSASSPLSARSARTAAHDLRTRLRAAVVRPAGAMPVRIAPAAATLRGTGNVNRLTRQAEAGVLRAIPLHKGG
jgi:hypothetical protein